MRATMERGWEMRSGKYKREEILKIVRENGEKHKKEYAEAYLGYLAIANSI